MLLVMAFQVAFVTENLFDASETLKLSMSKIEDSQWINL